MSDAIYLDHHATTPCDPRVVEAMAPFWSGEFGNAASRTHAFGWRAEEAVEAARAQVAALIGGDARDVVFTSGATEADNLAVIGCARGVRAATSRHDHVVTCVTEHRAVLDPVEALENEGFRVTRVGVDRQGRVDPGQVRDALEPATALVSIMHANNEIGVVQPLAEIGAITRERGVLLHSDAAQSAGRIPVDVVALHVDLLSLSAHKLYGPKGVGALWVRRRPRVPIAPVLHGGGHERGLRPGTLPVPLCVGFGEAARIAAARREDDAAHHAQLRDRLWKALRERLPGIERNGDPERTLPGNLNVSFLGVEAEALLLALPDVALSSGSACTSSKREPSHVLRALGVGRARTQSALRFGIGRGNDEAQIDAVVERVVAQVDRLRRLSPNWTPAAPADAVTS